MKRLQRQRGKGYKKPENSKYVGRPTIWGNPFKDVSNMVYAHYHAPNRLGSGWNYLCMREPGIDAVTLYRELLFDPYAFPGIIPDQIRVRFRFIRLNIESLAGKDLLCWCPLDKECHADALIDFYHWADDEGFLPHIR